MKNNKGFIGIGILIAIIAALVVGGGAVYFMTKPSTPYLKNTGDNIIPPVNQNSVSNTNIPVQNNQVNTVNKVAPSVSHIPVSTTISSQYITGTSWPPTIQTSSTAYSCPPASGEINTVVQKVINNKTYCINSTVDGGAGHWGGDYIYTKANGSGTKTATFQLQWGSCGVWRGDGTTKYSDCQAEQANVFNNLDAMVDSLI